MKQQAAISATALMALVGLPSIASATDLVSGLPPELGVWGIVGYAVVQLAQQIMTAIGDRKRASEAVTRAERAEAKCAELQAQIDSQERAAIEELRAEVARLREEGASVSSSRMNT